MTILGIVKSFGLGRARHTIFIYLLATTILLPACDRSRDYVPPDLTRQASATITGTRYPDPDPFSPDTRVYLVGVDGKLTGNGDRGWDAQTLVTPGTRVIRFGISKTNASTRAWEFVEFTVDLEAGKSYFLRATKLTRQSFGYACKAWIEDENNIAITAQQQVTVPIHTNVSPYYVPLPIIKPR